MQRSFEVHRYNELRRVHSRKPAEILVGGDGLEPPTLSV